MNIIGKGRSSKRKKVWKIIFDADRDNHGKGIDVERFIEALKKIV